MVELPFEWLVYGQIAIQPFSIKLKRKRKLRDTAYTVRFYFIIYKCLISTTRTNLSKDLIREIYLYLNKL